MHVKVKNKLFEMYTIDIVITVINASAAVILCLLEGSANKIKFIVLPLFNNVFYKPPFAQTKKTKIYGIKLLSTQLHVLQYAMIPRPYVNTECRID